jgi:hypothetical protein
VLVARGAELRSDSIATRALGVDADGFVVYAECAERAPPGALAAALREAGVARAMALPDAAELGLAVADALVSVDGQRSRPRSDDAGEGGLRFVAETRPAASVLFPEVKPMPYNRWGFLQGQRVRYFPSQPPRFRAPEDVLGKRPEPRPDAGTPAPPPAR